MTPWTVATGLFCPWGFSGNDPGVGYHSLLQGIFLAQGWNTGLLHCRQILYRLSPQGRSEPPVYWHKHTQRERILDSLCSVKLGRTLDNHANSHRRGAQTQVLVPVFETPRAPEPNGLDLNHTIVPTSSTAHCMCDLRSPG